MKNRLFTSESVSEGHPDKMADIISDSILDAYLKQDKNARVACETLVTTNKVVVAGEITSTAEVNIDAIVRNAIKEIGYDRKELMFTYFDCEIENLIHTQSPDIAQGVDTGGAGDQGIMFGYACDESEGYIPLTLYLSHLIVRTLADIRKKGQFMLYLRPDSKSQVTIEYDKDNRPVAVKTVLVSTQHSEDVTQEEIKRDIINLLMPLVIEQLPYEQQLLFRNTQYLVNPTGKFVIGGPHGDTGLTGRKIIVDTYGGKGAHGGGAFSGKDPSKVDRSAAYAARYLAKEIVRKGYAREALVQLSYAIGVAEPISINLNTFGTNVTTYSDQEVIDIITAHYDLTPSGIIKRFDLKTPIYKDTASYGHFGRTDKNFNWE